MSDRVRAFGDQGSREILRQFLGRDDMAGDRDDPSPERRGKAPGIAIGRDHDIAGGNRSAAGLDMPSGAGSADSRDRRIGTDGNAAPAAGLEQPLVIKRRMQFAGPLDDHAAEIIVAGDFFALPLSRHHVGAGLRGRIEYGEPPRLRVEMLLCPGADKAAGLLPETIDLLLADQPIDQAKGVGGVRQEPFGPLRLDIGGPAGEALADIDAAADRAAIAGAGAKAELAGFEHDRVDAVLGQFERRRQPGISAADDRDARRLAARRRGHRRGRIGLPPIRASA